MADAMLLSWVNKCCMNENVYFSLYSEYDCQKKVCTKVYCRSFKSLKKSMQMQYMWRIDVQDHNQAKN